jgi:hypothetical protein
MVRVRSSHFGQKIVSALVLALILFGALQSLSVRAASTPTGAEALKDRIGGTVGAFEDRYGDATNDPDNDLASVRTYDNKNYKNLSARAIDGYIYAISFDVPKTTTWNAGKAGTVGQRFVPADVQCDDPVDDTKMVTLTCISTALQAIMFPADYARVGRTGDSGSVTISLVKDKHKSGRIARIETVVGTEDAPVEQVEEDSAVAAPTVPAISSGTTADETAYLVGLSTDITLLTDSVGTMEILFDGVTVYDFVDPTWVSKLATVLGTWQYVYQESITRFVPAKYATLNAEWIAVTSPMNDAASYYAYGIDNFDATSIELANASVGTATDALDNFTPDFIAAINDAGVDTSI